MSQQLHKAGMNAIYISEVKSMKYRWLQSFILLYIFMNWLTRGSNAKPPRFSPYFAAGIGFFSFNPQAYIAKQLG